MAGKRKSGAADETKLERVVRALDNATRVGAGWSAVFVSAHSERFPLPAIAFKREQEDADERDGSDDDDDDDELLLPLRARDTRKIKARGTACQWHEEVATAWEVDGACVESRNPKWDPYLAEWLKSKRGAMRIAPGAVVEVKLRKMVLAEAGARLFVRSRRDERRSSGMFGTLVVVLPSAVKCDPMYVSQPHIASTSIWRVHGSPYGISLMTFYNDCPLKPAPVLEGKALCLVYDLVTSTPSEVPLFGGDDHVQQSIDSALTHYFEKAPRSPLKRVKIGGLEIITIATTHDHFVYPVTGSTYEKLNHDHAKVADGLAAFCAQSRGAFVLYHASLNKFRSSPPVSFSIFGYDDDVIRTGNNVRMALAAPWIKHGMSKGFDLPPISVSVRYDVASTGQIEKTKDWYLVDDTTGPAQEIVEELYRGEQGLYVYQTYALVVMPASVERSQIAQLPLTDVTKMLSRLLAKSRQKALHFARLVVEIHPDWQLWSSEMKAFGDFINLVVEINDCELFNSLLLAIHFTSPFPTTAFASAIKHFGWDACVDSLQKRIGSTSTLRGRVHLIVSAFYPGWGPAQLNPLLDALLTLHPWTDVKIGTSDYPKLDSKVFANLLVITDTVASERIRDVVAVLRVEDMLDLVLPAVTQLRSEYANNPTILATLRLVLELFKPMLNKLIDREYSLYTRIRIPDHCPACEALQSFLGSSVVHRGYEVSEGLDADHISEVIKRATSMDVQITREGSSVVRLKKGLHVRPNTLIHRAWVEAAKAKQLLVNNAGSSTGERAA